MPQRLLVPLFQRPYVWSLEAQWAPLWADIKRLADRAVARQPVARHFLGAVVMQQQFGVGGTAGKTFMKQAVENADTPEKLEYIKSVMDTLKEGTSKTDSS